MRDPRQRHPFRQALEQLEARLVADASEPMLVASPDAGGLPQVQVYRPDGSRVTQFEAFGSSFRGGVQVATGDVTGDQIPDLFCAPGAGGNPVVKVYDGKTLTLLRSIRAYAATFAGGVNVAVGDVLASHPGLELVVAPKTGGSPVVSILDPATGASLRSVRVSDGPTNGVRLAVRDVTSDGVDDLVVAPASGLPVVRTFDAASGRMLTSILAYNPAFRLGVYLAAGTAADGGPRLYVGPGAGGEPVVKEFDLATGAAVGSYRVFDSRYRGGVRVGAVQLADDPRTSIVVSAGRTPAPVVKVVEAGTGAELSRFRPADGAGTPGLITSGFREVSHRAAQPQWTTVGRILRPWFAGTLSRDALTAPCVVTLPDGRLRMYFTTRQGDLRYIYAAEASADNPAAWTLVEDRPMLGPSATGNLRNLGVDYPYVIQRPDGVWLMYYTAWGTWAPQTAFAPVRTSLAISHDQGLSWRVLKEPLFPLGAAGSYDAVYTGSMCVLQTGPQRYEMWYTGCQRTIPVGGANVAISHILHAVSPDGITWTKTAPPRPVVSPRQGLVSPFETVTSKPCVLRVDGVYHMWLSVYTLAGGGGYRLNYARSSDGVHWTRFTGDNVLPVTAGGFDSRHQAYPYAALVGDEVWLFYAGNDFGATGVGLARMPVASLLSNPHQYV